MSELKLGLIGQPVAHSRSPEIHGHFAEQFGYQLDYQKIDSGAEDLADKVKDFFRAGGQGLNVTLPHKKAVMALCTEVSTGAQLAEAVNTLIPSDAGLRGDNTDGLGCIADLNRLGIEIRGKKVLLIGAGGAARGVIAPLLAEQPQELVWSNRNPLKLEGQDEVFAAPGVLRCCANMALKGDQFDLIIHATAAGHQGLCPQLPHRLFKEGGVAYDLSYGKAAKPFLAWAKAQGAAATHDGYGMLIEQAAQSFTLWTGQSPDTQSLHQV